jgi:hypothetical protein
MTDVLRLMGEAQGLKFSHQDVSRDGSEGKAFCVLKCKAYNQEECFGCFR